MLKEDKELRPDMCKALKNLSESCYHNGTLIDKQYQPIKVAYAWNMCMKQPFFSVYRAETRIYDAFL